MSASSPGHHTYCRPRFFIWDTPWCALCNLSKTWACKLGGTTTDSRHADSTPPSFFKKAGAPVRTLPRQANPSVHRVSLWPTLGNALSAHGSALPKQGSLQAVPSIELSVHLRENQAKGDGSMHLHLSFFPALYLIQYSYAPNGSAQC